MRSRKSPQTLKDRGGNQGEREMENMGGEEYLWTGAWERRRWEGPGASEALQETWVGILLPEPALQYNKATLEAAVRIRIGCKGLTPTEVAKMDAAGGALDHQMSMVPSWPCVRVL